MMSSLQPVDVDLSAEVEARLNLKEKDVAAGSFLLSRPDDKLTDKLRHGDEEFPRLSKVCLVLTRDISLCCYFSHTS